MPRLASDISTSSHARTSKIALKIKRTGNQQIPRKICLTRHNKLSTILQSVINTTVMTVNVTSGTLTCKLVFKKRLPPQKIYSKKLKVVFKKIKSLNLKIKFKKIKTGISDN